MSKFLVKAPAKINLFLHILGKNSNYHSLESLLVFVNIYDILEVTIDAPRSGVYFTNLKINRYNNTITKVIYLLSQHSTSSVNVFVSVIKNILVSAGLAGGSADAAAVMRLLGNVWDIQPQVLEELALEIGSDVPACLHSKTLFARGRGEDILLLPDLCLPKYIVIVAPKGKPLSTVKVFNNYEPSAFSSPICDNLPVRQDDWLELIYNARNDLLDTALKFVPEIEEILFVLRKFRNCLIARMTGSGATCFALFNELSDAEVVVRELQMTRPDWIVFNAKIL
ncbi:4-(cytidine 5'-diphospho)-2-C-methyl-D-erythritol kinase [Ehrlichia ruminantium]|uniref:4-diphosphocytidyl-2-C-methyl-D-erythritol kinase n=1 Tax=Ehrlichia ruminantium (strain Welgevonden) TaxID=254945 RepID=ISPE_EHRRW|nr:4-(cytidine 5'-diphospho)-2-C-methyl-D-erythritol kinase [Ehrlichia ruminantium]Q5HBJ6.1 RecName: Full=4-diphosphocytidyl-2-C-methyl-D-erythritol kinase; Short=CMK; AltName: Full=4-(cytidine-5'-diphospho)-2-C-methyl-D-erythritol kinase [Ehrlichia ruminantium str. Welgevonden]QLK55009.1 4-(cytidine 5'-diphospho)-2-C-methyl-D-erythritol kinase [Ehrlichia ruminantium]QLK55927.1 4-(cytidine 5'-diphospho)-2-C-methyl-D-erythritol kinase [Ehrlichia ruminantium]UOE00029.1 4-(cytidine 5'-diphospho)-2